MNRMHAAAPRDVAPSRESLTRPLVQVIYPEEAPGELSGTEVDQLLDYRPPHPSPAAATERLVREEPRSARGILWGFALSLAVWAALAWALEAFQK